MRKLRRNVLKNKLGNNKIKETWRGIQIKIHGMKAWAKMYKKCVMPKDRLINVGDIMRSPYSF